MALSAFTQVLLLPVQSFYYYHNATHIRNKKIQWKYIRADNILSATIQIKQARMSNQPLSDLTQPQRDRLAFIELRLRFLGEIRRQDLVSRFGIQAAAASRDLALYKELAPGNIDYDSKAKTYILGPSFKSVFNFQPERVLSWLTQGFGDGEPTRLKAWIVSESPSCLTFPDLDVLASVTRAMHQQCPLGIEYFSISSGSSTREIVPFALIDNGLRWHVRAFDRKSKEFRDFVITRIKSPVVLKGQLVEPQEKSDQDIQWTRIVELELVPHPDQPRPEITEMDYSMPDGVLKMKIRAAVAGYTLRRWSVDCSPDHSLRGPEYRLWLKDHLALYGVKNALLAPGYASLNEKRLETNTD